MNIRNAIALSAVVLALGLTGAAPSAARAATEPSSAEITGWVRNALREDPRIYAADLQVTTDDGIVTISGTVWNLSERRYAVLEAKKIRGVRAVIDRIETMPLTRPDADIRSDVERRIAVDPALPADDIAVRVEQGEVTLTGTVDSFAEKQEAGTVAGEVLGLRDLHNQLETRWENGRSDAEIGSDVRAALDRDVYVADQPIRSSVRDGVVHLEGEVGTAYQKMRASELAWVDNVIDVKNDLQVRPGLDESVRRTLPAPSDVEIAATVTAVLARDLRIDDPYRVEVKVHDGTVTLDGVVRNRSEWQIADSDARNVVGVGWVTNLLMVNADHRDDAAVRDDVRFNLESDWALAGQDIGVRADRGVVTLTGIVGTPFEKAHATDVAGRVAGVSRVVNALDVRPEDFYSDASIHDRIRDRLEADWLTSWRHPEITVEVHDGKVTLTGTVDTWAERAEAGRVASTTAGVWRVENDLAVADVDYPWRTAAASGPRGPWDQAFDLFRFDLFDLPL